MGATGILAPAVADIVARGEPVVAVARDPGRLAALARLHTGVTPAAADCADPAQLVARVVAAVGRPARALVYCPDAPAAALRTLAAAVDGRAVLLMPSRWAAPAGPEDASNGAEDTFVQDGTGDPDLRALAAATGGAVLLLGWRPDGGWHHPSAISRAALRVLDTGRSTVLGTVRPWSGRPQ